MENNEENNILEIEFGNFHDEIIPSAINTAPQGVSIAGAELQALFSRELTEEEKQISFGSFEAPQPKETFVFTLPDNLYYSYNPYYSYSSRWMQHKITGKFIYNIIITKAEGSFRQLFIDPIANQNAVIDSRNYLPSTEFSSNELFYTALVHSFTEQVLYYLYIKIPNTEQYFSYYIDPFTSRIHFEEKIVEQSSDNAN
ncbi:MAG: hypothetical protein AABY27_04605, partial [Pseudomonadota bacterium]